MGTVENPIRKIRLARRQTLLEFSRACGVHLQAVFLTEQGCYHYVPPSIMHHVEGRELIRLEYAAYQKSKRESFGALFEFSGFAMNVLGPPLPSIPPVVGFRRHIGLGHGFPTGLSRMAFAKSFCVAPSELFDLENGRKGKLSEQFITAMRHAGLPGTVLNELQYRCQEYGSGEWISDSGGVAGAD